MVTDGFLQTDLFGQPARLGPTRPATGRAKPARRATAALPSPGPLSEPAPAAADAPPPPLDESVAIDRLEETGRFRVLRKLEPRPVRPERWPPAARSPGAWPRLGIVLDTETTGLDAASNEVIELGMVAFTYDKASVLDVVGVFSALQQPTRPLPPEITRITGLTDAMLAGQRIDLAAAERFVAGADLVIAHNARFDRPFCEKILPVLAVKPWACSVAEVDWVSLGFEGTKLGYLIGQCGFFHNGHRATDDCHALLEVLAQPARKDAPAAFAQLVASAARTRLRIHALGSPFHTKDVLKARGYRWSDGASAMPKGWWREVEEDGFEEEARFLETEIYNGAMNAHVERLTACERFKG